MKSPSILVSLAGFFLLLVAPLHADRADADHTSPDGKFKVRFHREGDEVVKIEVALAAGQEKPFALLDGNLTNESWFYPTYLMWSPDSRMVALRIGDGPLFSRVQLFRHTAKGWQQVKLPELMAKEKKRLKDHNARTVHEEPAQWADARTLVIATSGTYTQGEHGDGFDTHVSIRVDDQGKATIIAVKPMVIE